MVLPVGEQFHASLVRDRGGERRYISAAVRRSKIIMGPPHRGRARGGRRQGEQDAFLVGWLLVECGRQIRGLSQELETKGQ